MLSCIITYQVEEVQRKKQEEDERKRQEDERKRRELEEKRKREEGVSRSSLAGVQI